MAKKSQVAKKEDVKKPVYELTPIEEIVPLFKTYSMEDIEKILQSLYKSRLYQRSKDFWVGHKLELRRLYIQKCINDGMSKPMVHQRLKELLGIETQCAYRYIKDAMDNLVENNEEVKKYYRDIQISRTEQLLNMSIARGDLKNALTANEQLNKINGIYNEKVETEVKHIYKFNFGGDENSET
jgi:hypothetical protein